MKRLIILLPLALSALALTACGKAGGDNVDAAAPRTTTTARTASPDHGNDEPSEKGQAVLFALDLHDHYSDDLEAAADAINEGAEAVGDGDFDRAADKADEAGDIYAEIHSGVQDLDGFESDFGQKVYEVTGQCSDAVHDSAQHVRDLDFDAMQDTSDLHECSDGMSDIARMAASYI